MIRTRNSSPLGQLRSEKITPRRLERLAVVYVRQSTVQQALDHQESTRLQYGLVSQAQAWGWSEERVLIIDEDLGKSGTSAEGRSGFQRLVSDVGLGHVGLILGMEMSRLARSSKDWHQLLELCALFGALNADLDGIYNPAEYNDRLLLGLKGTMSAGELVLDPDAQVQEVIRLIFRKFEELGTLNAVLRYLADHRVEVGIRVCERGSKQGVLEWHRPNRMTLQNLLRHPI